MKKIIITILIIGIIAGVWYGFHQHSTITVDTTANTDSTTVTASAGHPNPSNATFQFDGQPVTLTNGKNVSPVSPDSAMSVETDLTNTIAYGDLNNDGKDDAAFILVQDGGGSGTFLYVAAFVSGNVSYKGTSAIFVGDRVQPESISIKNGVVTLTYLDRNASDPMSATPSVETTKTFVFKNGDLSAQ